MATWDKSLLSLKKKGNKVKWLDISLVFFKINRTLHGRLEEQNCSFSVQKYFSACKILCLLEWDPLHTYPDIFESATFSFRIQKFPRQHISALKSNLLVHTYHIQHVSGFTLIHSSTQDSSRNIGNRACVVKRGKFPLALQWENLPWNEVAILTAIFTVKNWARSCCVT